MNQIEWILYLLRDDLDDRQAAKLQSVLENVLQVHRSIPPLDEIIGKFERAKRIVGIKDTTLKQYSIEVRSLARYIDKPLCIIASSDIKDYLARYMEERKVSSVTIQNKLHFLSSFFDYLVDNGYISKNPARGVGRILVEKRIKKAYSPDDLTKIRAACTSSRDRALVEFLYSTGARVSECTSLRVQDVDFRASEVVLFGKGHKERVAYLNAPARHYLKIYLSERGAGPGEPLFSGSRVRKPAPITSRAVETAIQKIGVQAGVANVHPHRFRRTFATNLWKSGIPAESIRIMMGHSNIATTLRYIDIEPGGVKQAHFAAMATG